MKTTWKDIPPVPTSQEFLDIVLSRTQRRLPTQIRAGFKISRIRGFYTRKVRFTAETFATKFQEILDGFPRLQDIHPFHKDLLNTLYDQDHFKVALGQVSTAKHLIETIARDYVRLLKYGQSLYQCKQLKIAALGRMATVCKKLKDSLLYLDNVRQHLGRLPGIDPNTRTLLVCGFPNVGKSSFVRSVSRADVEVQPYAFTTKSLFVGHFDHRYLRFQVIDTPGVLDHPLEEMNTIEMQSVVGLAHLRACILYFFDLSEQCGYPVSSQIALYKSLSPLFANKLRILVINKKEVLSMAELDDATKAEFESLLKSDDTELMEISCNTGDGVQALKQSACDKLIASRTAEKLKAGTSNSGTVGGRLAEVMTRIHVAQPMGGVVRETHIPEGIKNLKKYDRDDPERKKLAREIQDEQGGAGVFNVDLRGEWKLDDPAWAYDKIPEVFDGKNVYDYIDPDIEKKLAALEEEEERLEKEGFYASEDEGIDSEEEAEIMTKAEQIREKRMLIRNEARLKKSLKNRAIIPRKKVKIGLGEMDDALDRLGVDTTNIMERARSQSRPRGRSLGRSRAGTADPDAMDMDVDQTPKERLRSKSRPASRAPETSRRDDGVTDMTVRSKAERQAKVDQRKMNRMARQGEADRHIGTAMPKHLFAGKRGGGKTSRR